MSLVVVAMQEITAIQASDEIIPICKWKWMVTQKITTEDNNRLMALL